MYDQPAGDDPDLNRGPPNGLRCNNNDDTKNENFVYYDDYDSQSDSDEEINVT